jgi:hypothetical protein
MDGIGVAILGGGGLGVWFFFFCVEVELGIDLTYPVLCQRCALCIGFCFS